ncbi:MAG: methyltransferase [Clostridiales bacterium]|jgi:tRNA1(Val) A37 N6-methylase TrmN6|nr:methyltransferase [Clostridiales bacterium]
MDEKDATRLDDLQYKGLFLYQRRDLPCFSQDSVLLSHFADTRHGERAVDIGAGTGVIAVLNGARTGAQFTCIERNAALCALLKKSIAHNGLRDISVCEMDWRDAPDVLGHARFGAALCNPPYFNDSSPSPDAARALARSGEGAMQGAVSSAAALLKEGGRLYLSCPVMRLADAICALRANRLEPKRLQLIANKPRQAPHLALIKARKGGKPALILAPVLCLTDETGQPSAEYNAIYHIPNDKSDEEETL